LKIVVCIKQVPDSAASVTVHEGKVLVGNAPYVLNPWDEYAVEVALRLCEQYGGEVSAVSIAKEDEKEAIHTALAMGCKEAIRIDASTLAELDTLVSAQLLAAAIRKCGSVDLVCMGMQAIDSNYGVLPAQTARLLGWRLVSLVSKVDALDVDKRVIRVERVTDEGKQLLEAKLPLVMTFVKEVAEPRYPSFMGMRKAAKAQIPSWTLEDLGVAPASAAVRAIELFAPPAERGKSEIIQGDDPLAAAEQLVEKLVSMKVLE